MGSIEDVIKAAEEMHNRDSNIDATILKEVEKLNAKVELINDEVEKGKYGYVIGIFFGIGTSLFGASLAYAVAGNSLEYRVIALGFFVFSIISFAIAIAIQQEWFGFMEFFETLSRK